MKNFCFANCTAPPTRGVCCLHCTYKCQNPNAHRSITPARYIAHKHTRYAFSNTCTR